MGGAAAGEVAARLAAESIKHVLVAAGPAVSAHPTESLECAVDDANRAILNEAQAHPEERGMGTTCTAAIVLPDRLCISQVGDSRAYLLRGGTLQALTRDQSLATQLVDSGALQPDQASTFPYRHVLVQALGTRSTISPVTTETPLQTGDRILLCSDGLHGPVGEDGIAAILAAVRDVDQATHQLIEAALAAGGPDNVTVVVADCA
jgi:protein phosphatase